jgi:hypothetical protein
MGLVLGFVLCLVPGSVLCFVRSVFRSVSRYELAMDQAPGWDLGLEEDGTVGVLLSVLRAMHQTTAPLCAYAR